ncbi:condensin II complex subunit [Aureococcus anophagefferens]|uniref:Condensin II complex subunit n=1 Tax=Aureococcus anophagefferens TaxID=44056 RepID=A0ABR1FSF2_AURAN
MPARRPAPDAMDTEDAPLTAAEKFQALLRPIKDVALAFDVDVDEALEEYVEECVRYVVAESGDEAINFAEAGLLVQGSAVVYGRKVDGLHGVVYKVLENLRTGKAQADAAGRDAAATKVAEASGEDEFGRRYDAGPLARVVDVTPGKTVDLDVDKEESKRKKARTAPADPMVALLFRDVEEDAPFFGAAFGADGGLRLPGLALRGARAPPEEAEDAPDPYEEMDVFASDDVAKPLRRGKTWRAPKPPAADARARRGLPAVRRRGAGAALGREERGGGGDDDDDYDCDDAWAAGGVARLFADPEELAAPDAPDAPRDFTDDFDDGGGECFAWDDDGYDDRLGAAGGRRSEAYDAACKAHLDELGANVASYEDLARLADRVAAWQAKLEPVLRAQETEREPFDMLAIGRDIVARLAARKPGDKAKVGFGSLAGGIPRYRVCRHFLATLQLANNGNLDLEHAHGADALAPADAFKLALLTTVNAHDSLHEGDFENH